MDDLKLQRRPIQFSLRKLMLWMAVCALYLGILRLVGAGTILTVFSSSWLGSLLIVRITLGPHTILNLAIDQREEASKRASRRRAAVATSCVTACFFGGLLFRDAVPALGWKKAMIGPPLLGLVVGTMIGIFAYIPISLVVLAVDRIDALMQAKRSKEQ